MAHPTTTTITRLDTPLTLLDRLQLSPASLTPPRDITVDLYPSPSTLHLHPHLCRMLENEMNKSLYKRPRNLEVPIP